MSKPWLVLLVLAALGIRACALVRAQGPYGDVTISHAQCSKGNPPCAMVATSISATGRAVNIVGRRLALPTRI